MDFVTGVVTDAEVADVQGGDGDAGDARSGSDGDDDTGSVTSSASRTSGKGKGKAKKTRKPKQSSKLRSQEDEETLVEWVLENPMLWNSGDRDFMQRGKKQRLWQEKAAQMNYDVEKVQRWWKDLRDVNTRLHKTKSGSGLRTYTDREMWVMTQLAFLTQRIRHRRLPIQSVSTH